MTKKDYVLIADILVDFFRQAKVSESDFHLLVHLVGNALYRDNSKFSYDRFEKFIEKKLTK